MFFTSRLARTPKVLCERPASGRPFALSVRGSPPPEVLPPQRLKFITDAALLPHDNLPPAHDVPDVRDGHSGNAGRNALARRSCEAQFVVFSTVQRKLQIDLPRRLANTGPGDGFCL